MRFLLQYVCRREKHIPLRYKNTGVRTRYGSVLNDIRGDGYKISGSNEKDCICLAGSGVHSLRGC